MRFPQFIIQPLSLPQSLNLLICMYHLPICCETPRDQLSAETNLKSRDFSEELVSIVVRDKRKKYVAYKKVVCKSCWYFKAAFKRLFQEAQKGEFYMQEQKPEAVALLINYLYKSEIPMHNTESHLRNLYEL